ncbi:hypothetical protein K503DRAFT_492145 [Rhizopogon vinicolor AM-OR11-026]|uniref:Uncharacterized protein n=1 Tax=Rhizopogon vinicolor AM-OR11-026 TaxID=1314800 RepID=A0A1B7MMI9_9AGAM|nr:hypothetical protein K503DRAFT_492145 [Rhizopogon vinicolor AM-OR11-026]
MDRGSYRAHKIYPLIKLKMHHPKSVVQCFLLSSGEIPVSIRATSSPSGWSQKVCRDVASLMPHICGYRLVAVPKGQPKRFQKGPKQLPLSARCIFSCCTRGYSRHCDGWSGEFRRYYIKKEFNLTLMAPRFLCALLPMLTVRRRKTLSKNQDSDSDST